MPYKRLDKETELPKFIEMAKSGNNPKDIAAFFGIGISTVHHYKNKLRKEGINFPDVKGKRPTGEVNFQERGVHKSIEPGSAVIMQCTVDGVDIKIGTNWIELSSPLIRIDFEDERTLIEF